MMTQTQNRDEVVQRIEETAMEWLTGGEPDTGIELLEKKISVSFDLTDQYGYFLARSEKSITILYVWNSMGTYQVSQETSYIVENDGELQLARYLFNVLTRRI